MNNATSFVYKLELFTIINNNYSIHYSNKRLAFISEQTPYFVKIKEILKEKIDKNILKFANLPKKLKKSYNKFAKETNNNFSSNNYSR